MARRYARDNKGRFASSGSGATARGGRLRTAAGNKRKTQTMESAAKPKGTIGKPKGLKPGAIKANAAAAKPTLKRTGQKAQITRMTTNAEQGRRGIVSMSPIAKSVRSGDVANRRSERLARIAERQSGIAARRSINRGSNYNPDGTFNQSAANTNQIKTKRSKQLQDKLAFAASGTRTASDALKRRTTAKPARAAAKPAVKSSKLGFSGSDFAKRSQRTARIRNPEVKATAQRIYGRIIDANQTPRQLKAMFKKAGKPKAKKSTAESRRRQREHQNMLAAAKLLFR